MMLEKYLRLKHLPHIWCPGCGNGIITAAVLRAIDRIGMNPKDIVVVSGIGCSSRVTGYLNFNTFHTLHGRAIPFATGIKLMNPKLNVIVITGDGDCAAIGGNHLIHACRRNINLTTIVYNNSIYGMTSGQFSPLTPGEAYAITAPYGNVERSFDLANLAVSAGATYVARATAYHSVLLTNLIIKGLRHKGFSLIEAIAQCPTYFGRKNKMPDPVDMLLWQKDHAVTVKEAQTMKKSELKDKFIIGDLHSEDLPEYTELYNKIIEKAFREAQKEEQVKLLAEKETIAPCIYHGQPG